MVKNSSSSSEVATWTNSDRASSNRPRANRCAPTSSRTRANSSATSSRPSTASPSGRRRAPRLLQPLPDLRARDFRGGGVFHQVVDRHRALAAEPRLEILDADPNVMPEAGFGAGAGGGSISAAALATTLREADPADWAPASPGRTPSWRGHQPRVRHPCAVVTLTDLAQLVGADLFPSRARSLRDRP